MKKLRIVALLLFWLNSLLLSGQEVYGGYIGLAKKQIYVFEASVKYAIRTTQIPSVKPYIYIDWGDGSALDSLPFTTTAIGGVITIVGYVGTHTFAPVIGNYTISTSDKFFVPGVVNIPGSSLQKLSLQRMIHLDFQNIGITEPSKPWDDDYFFDSIPCTHNFSASMICDGWDSTSYSIVSHPDIPGYLNAPIGWQDNNPVNSLITCTANASGGYNVRVRTNEWRHSSLSPNSPNILMGWFDRDLYISVCNVVVTPSTTAIENLRAKSENSLFLFPNPFNEVITVSTNIQGEKEISLLSGIGQVLMQTKKTTERFDLDLSQYAKGVYLLQVQTETGLLTRRIVKE